jgi:hypothetical protein
MCDQASPRSGINGQEGGGIQGWVPSRCRRSPDGVGPMHEKALHKAEKSIGKAMLEVICDMGVKRLPLLSHETMHLVANAIAVYQAVATNGDRGRPPE